ncbi:nitrogen regulation protein NR(I) [Tardibacter chloracetimidivorans]|uniref:DNA-binding transcriptional regulator NtrC n=1 Tax=Tardibacter chloracetimidivorans TaxID=1921510 RepID=A0A1L3ZTI3_9SPHN|nr:nitrogen regulation protein NR(I) [Tardibacter chloracetimidivorans]API58952.1 nitrogen regulation protein NR(I) [Tardibacter chloracetimidivorans]
MSPGKILVVDDDAAIRTVVSEALKQAGHEVRAVPDLASMRLALAEGYGEVLVTDVMLPDGNGLDVVPEIISSYPNLPVIVLSAQNTLATAVRATERGAFEYLPKPFDLDELARAVQDALVLSRKEESSTEGDDHHEPLPLIGRSAAMQEVYRTIARVVPNDLTVLVLGESGTGKELVARAIHDLGPRSKKSFVAINMAAIPRELIESELFGHERGAFTGAQARTSGRFEQAQGGTLFLDEIGDMPMDAQTRLLRVLQSGEFTTVGGARAIRADVRIIAATNKDLRKLVEAGQFREDLFYRLNVVPVRIPPLRARADDIAELARYFLDQAAALGLPRKTLNPDAVNRLMAHPWPGNVRELENLMRRLAALSREEAITAGAVEQGLLEGVENKESLGQTAGSLGEAMELYLARLFAAYDRSLPPDGLYERVLAEIEPPLLLLSLAAARGNQVRAARLLGMNRNTLRKKLAERGIDAPTVRRMG